MNPNLDTQLLETKAQNQTAQKNFPQASVTLQRILKHHRPKKAKIYCWLGDLDSEQKEHIKVRQKYKKAFLFNDPSFPKLRYHWASTLCQQNRFAEAYSELGFFLETNKSNAGALHLLANVSFQLGLYKEADQTFKQALRINPNLPNIYEDWASVCYFLEDFDRAKECLIKAVAADPRASEAHRRLGYIYLAEQGYEEAIDCFEKALEINNTCSLTWLNWGLALMLQNKEEEALAKLNKGLEFLENGEFVNQRVEVLEVFKNDLEFKHRYVESGKDEKRKVSFRASLESLKKIILLVEKDNIRGENISLKADQKETVDI